MKPEEFEVYVIPPNFMEGGTLFGGLLKTRNTVEAVILGLAVGVPVLHLPFSLTVRVVILCLTALPLVLLALIGVSGMRLSAFIRLFFCFLHNRRILSRDGTQGGKNGKTLLPSWAQQRKSDCEAEDPPLPKSRSRFSVDLKQRSVTQFKTFLQEEETVQPLNALADYGIAGHNYVKLRDIGKAVGFNVFWDADSGCVQIETDAPYTGEAPSAEAVPPAAAPSDVDAAKQDIVARTNALRAERGIAALAADDQLMRAAQVRADEMAATGNYSHTRPDGRKYYTVTDCRQVGENIHQIPLLYLAQQKTALAETLVYSWSKSAGHMENMTDESYAAIGVGLARGTDANGLECWYCVQLFLRSGYSISAVDKPATK